MNDQLALNKMMEALEILQYLQQHDANRTRAVAVTNLETAILWGQRDTIKRNYALLPQNEKEIGV